MVRLCKWLADIANSLCDEGKQTSSNLCSWNTHWHSLVVADITPQSCAHEMLSDTNVGRAGCLADTEGVAWPCCQAAASQAARSCYLPPGALEGLQVRNCITRVSIHRCSSSVCQLPIMQCELSW